MIEYSYLSSLKDREFSILWKLCNDSTTPSEKEKLEQELKETRSEIEKLG